MASLRPVTADEIESLAIGAWILGTGGGGSPYLALLNMRRLYREGTVVSLMDPMDLADDDDVAVVSNMGAPLVGQERLTDPHTIARAVTMMEEYLGRPFRAIMSLEIGGGNAIQPFMAAALLNRPVVDGDCMGRAFPEAQMTSFAIHDLQMYPLTLVDVRDNAVVVARAASWKWMERLSRTACVAVGSIAGTCKAPRTGKEIKDCAILYSTSKAIRIGQTVQAARRAHRDPIEALIEAENGRLLFTGKIADVARRATEGFLRGTAKLDGLGAFRGQRFELAFQNEFAVGWLDGVPTVTTPDLICVLDTVSGDAIGTETLRYGQRVNGDRAAGAADLVDAQRPQARGTAGVWLRPGIHLGIRMRRIGIDVGGTNTDAVLLDGTHVVHAVKTPTTADVTSGITTALRELLAAAGSSGPVDAVMIGTTHFTNAVVQRRDLTRVAAVRIGLPASASLPPFVDWPEDLADLVRGEVVMLEGGHEYDGRPIVPLDETGMRDAARRIRAAGITSVAIASVFSPLNAECETRAAAILRQECPDAARDPVARAGPHRPAGARERDAAQRRAGGPGAADDAGLHRGAAGQRPRRAALSHPERRHGDAGGHRRGLPRLQLRVRPHQQHAGRRVPLGAERRDRHRRRRHHHRHRQPAARLPARGQQRRRGRRRPHALPHARSAVDRPRRRLAGAPTTGTAWVRAASATGWWRRAGCSAAPPSPPRMSRSPPA